MIHVFFGKPVINDTDFVEIVSRTGSVSDNQVVQLEVIVDIASVVDYRKAVEK